jgi:glycosyltransferase involved in cell wall biosynthesis
MKGYFVAFKVTILFSLFLSLSCFYVDSFAYVTKINDNLEYVSFSKKREIRRTRPSILLTRTRGNLGGVANHTIALYQKLYQSGVNITLLVPKNSAVQKELEKAKLPHYATFFGKSIKGLELQLFYSIMEICKRQKIDIIHTNKEFELAAAKKFAQIVDVSIVAQFHNYWNPCSKFFAGIDGFTSPSMRVVEFMKNEKEKKHLEIPFVDCISIMARNDKFSKFRPKNMGKNEFFQSLLGVDVGDVPVICTIANLERCKNHKILLAAAHKLIYEHQIPVILVFAGSGCGKWHLKNLANKLGLQQSVYFLGFINNVAELLHYSDIKVLPSKGDCFPLAVLEAAIMKKPIVLSKTVGSANSVIIHGKTGLLFNPQKADDLALQIKKLVQDKEYARKLGENAYTMVTENFSEKNIMKQYISFYEKIYLNRKNRSK